MTQVPNIKDTIKYIQDNNKAMEAIVKGAASTMISISEETEGVNLRKATKRMRHIASGMISYMGIVTNIIEELSRPYDNSKDLMQLLGYTEFDSDGKKLKKPQYKTIEALQQISTVMKDVVSFMFELSKQDLGFKAQKNIRRNIRILRSTMEDLTKFIIKEFSTIISEDNAYEIIELMMGAPGSVVKELQEIDDSTKTNSEKDNEKLRKRLEKKETEIQRGKKFGLLEVITSSLNIVSQLNSIQFAGPLEFRKKLFILRKQLTLIFKSLGQMWTEISKDKSVFNFISFMNKDDNNLFNAITNTGKVLDVVIKHGKIKNLFSIQVAIWAYSLFSEALTRLANMITDDRGAFAKLSDKALTKRIETVKKNITIISDIFKTIALMGLIAIPMLTLGLLIFPALWLMEGIIKVMVNVLNRIDSLDADKKLKELNSSIIGIIKIQAWLILMALVAAPAIIAMIIDLIFMGALLLFVKMLDLVFNAINGIIDRRFNKGLREFSTVLLVLGLIMIVIITLAISVEATLLALGILVIFMLGLIVFTLVAYVALSIINELIGGKTYAGLLELIVFLGIVLVIGVILVLMGKYLEEATQACWNGLLFILALIVFVVVLGVVAITVNSLIVPFTLAITGLGILIAVLGLFLVITLLLAQVSKLYDQMSLEAVMGSIGIALAATTGLIALGMLGMGAVLALAFMPMNVALVAMFYGIAAMLNKISKMEFDYETIKKRIDDALYTVKYIKYCFGDFEIWDIKTKRKAKRQIKDSAQVVQRLFWLGFKLNLISKLKLNGELILKNVGIIFDTVLKIEEYIDVLFQVPKNEDGSINHKELIANTVEDAVQGIMSKKKMDRADRILIPIYRMTKKLNKIQNIQIEWDKIEKNLDICFNTVDKIQAFIDKRNALPDNWTDQAVVDMVKQNWEDNLNYKLKMKTLGRSDVVLSKIHDITKTLNEIQKFKFDQKDDILVKLGKLFDVVDAIDAYINERNSVDVTQMGWGEYRKHRKNTAREELQKEIEAQAITRSSKIMTDIGEIVKVLKELNKLKDEGPNAVTNVTTIMDSIDQIHSIISTRANKTVNENLIDNATIQVIGERIKFFNDEISKLSKLDDKKVTNTEKTLNNYSKFLTKVDSLKVENLTKTASVFEQMARFSESIDGNFERLAETINENLMPVLEELKQIMNESSDRLEKGFNSTTETLVATSPVPVSKSGMKDIVKAGNPGMSDSQASAAADKKLADQMRSQNQTLASKLDEVIDLLSGRGRINAMVTY